MKRWKIKEWKAKDQDQRRSKEKYVNQRKEGQKGIPTPGTDVLMSFTVSDVGCKGRNKKWTQVPGSPPQEGQRGCGLFPFHHDRKGGNCKIMNGAGKGKSCRWREVYIC